MKIVLTHKNADFDALASSIAASLIYKGAVPALPLNINANVKNFLSIHKKHFNYISIKEISDINKIRKIIITDTNRWNRIENSKMFSALDAKIHVWDHHPGESDISAEWLWQENCGSVTSLLVSRISKKRIPVSAIEATLFLAGVYEDTGNLSFTGSKGIDARAVAYLLDNGADLDIVNSFLKPKYGDLQKQILFEMLDKGRTEEINGNISSINIVDVQGHAPGLSLIVDMYQKIMGIEVAFGIFIDKKRKQSMIIGRSAVDNIDIGHITSQFGGGGKARAGSAVVKSIDGEDLKSKLIDIIENSRSSSPKIGDLMSYPVITVPETTSMKDLALVFREKGCTAVPVTKGNSVVGMIARSDFRKIRNARRMDAPVKAFMSGKVVGIDLNKTVSSATRLMVKHDIGRLPVLKDNELVGIITRTDAMRYYYDLLPD